MKRDSLFCLKQPHVYCSTTMLNTGVCFSVLEVYLSLVLVSGYKILLGKLRHQHTSFSLSVPCTAYYLALSGCLIVCIFPLIMSSALPCSVVSNSLRPHGLQTIRLLCPLNFPGKDTGVGYHSLLLGILDFPGDSDGRESACTAEDLGWIPGLGRSREEGNSYPFQYSGLENSMNKGAWQATVHGVTKSRM